ncbi:MAG: glycoside hydrolase family 25 protein [Candidatus Nanopelagicales bacterium]|jgi:GH25 family lysozyme M1 (1,4-beta-N-acetylmuramidase)|nr:glycoside hydrolase family 25 protein [Candidatus Nanopelagicales bacterium]MCU0296509.1 glycoside hydrolase family 25 protein [Candidatus Nanopelagicales bacterium]MCU0298655.1 glycoside hydrolase family 25 protein [Candidatus Nanopelagicales bacterium]
MNRTVLAVGAAGLCAAVAAVGIQPVLGYKPKPKATSWKHQGLSDIRGVDVSRWQHIGPGVLDFRKLQRSGVRFAIIKSGDTSGSAHAEAGYWYGRDKVAARRAGLLVGAYYYATPTSNRSRVVADAKAQARKASARVGGRLQPGHLPLALDLETENTRLGRADLTRWATTWLRVVEKRTGRTPWFYSYTRYMERRLLPDPELHAYPLWHANWGLFLKQRPMQIRGWPRDHARIWQFTDSGRLPGSGSRALDLNVYRGTGEELLAEAGLGPEAAQRYDIPLNRQDVKPSPKPSTSVSPTMSPSPSVSSSPAQSPA